MSTTIDQRVVEMQFDNRHFERNVSNTMSTLDKLKQKLNLSGASKGLENVNTAAKNVNMNGLAQGVETVRMRFSALQVMGVTALTNITNQAVNAGKRIVSALTIDPIKTGFQEYETQISAVQTILANTSHAGTDINDINKALDELNKYADQTIYNFTEMTRNIGTFTAAGVDLQTSVDSIKGIANLAAVSGSTSQQASTAMYQLSQALAAGKVSLMDWNSVVNAGMGGKVFQDALVRTSELLKTGAKDAINTYGSFRESLTQGEWLTTEVLTETLKQLSGAYTEADLIAQGFTEEQAKEITKLAETASDAATKVKTFTQLWDVLKEAAQSGWTQTWELIIGDFEEAKGLLTPLSDFLTGAINKISDWRNTLIEGAFGMKVKSLGKAIEKFTSPIKKTTEAVKDAIAPIKGITKSLEEHKLVVSSIINGEWGHGEKRWNALTEAGYDWVHAQNLVNEQLGSSVRRTSEFTESIGKNTSAKTESTEVTEELAKNEIERLANMTELSDAELEALGYTKEQIKAFKELRDISQKLGIPIDELIEKADEIDGRWLFIESFKNIGKSIVAVFKSIGAAWGDVFESIKPEQLFDVLAGFHRITANMRRSIEEITGSQDGIDKLRKTFAGLFAVVDILTTLLGGGFKIAFKFVEQLLGYFNLDILDVTAAVGDALVAFSSWIDECLDFGPIIEKIGPFVERLVTGIKNLVKAVKGSAAFQKFVEYLNSVKSGLGDLFANIPGMESFQNLVDVLKNAGGSIKDWIETLKSSKNLPADIISGLAQGIRDGAPEVWSAIVTLATELWAKFCEVLGIHSPSTVFIAIGKFIIAGLILGLIGSIPGVQDAVKSVFGKITEFTSGLMPEIQNGLSGVWDVIKTVFGKIVNFLSGIDWGAVFAIGLVAASLFVIKQLSDAIQALAAPFEGFSNFMDSLAEAVDNVSKGISKKLKAEAFKSIADAILVLALAFAAIAFTVKYAGVESVGWAIGILAGLVIAMGALSWAIGKLGPADVKQMAVYVFSLAGISVSILVLAAAMAVIAKIDPSGFDRAMNAIYGLCAVIVVLVAASNLAGPQMGTLGATLLQVSAAMLILAYIMKTVAGMDDDSLIKGGLFVAGFTLFVLALTGISRLAGTRMASMGKSLVSIGIALGIIVGVTWLIGKLDPETMAKGYVGILAFALIIKALVWAVKSAGKDAPKIGSTLLAMAAAIGILSLVVRILASMEWEALGKGVAGVTALAGIITGLTAAVSLAGKDAPKIAGTLIAMSTAILILAGTSLILSMISIEGLAKGITAVGLLSGLMTMMIHALKDAKNVKGSLIAMTVMIGILTMAVAALCLIPTEKLLPAAGALTAVMSAMALMMYSMKSMEKVNGKSLLNLLAMVGVVVALGAIVYGLSLIPNPENALKNVGAVSALMGAMTLMLIPLTLIGKLAGNAALKGVLALTAMVVPLAAFVAALHFMPEITVTEDTLLKLVTLMTAMTLLLVPLTLIGALGGFTALLGVLALTAMVVPLAAFCLALNYLPDVTKATGNVILLTTLMTAMTALLIPLTLIGLLAVPALAGVVALTAMVVPLAAFGIALALLPDITDSVGTLNILISVMYTMTNLLYLIAPIGPLALIGVTALAALEAVMVSVGALAAAVGALDFIGLGMFIDKGIPILENLANAVGSILGNVITGFTDALANGLDSLPLIGTHLSNFMTNCEGFISGAKTVDDKVLAGVGILSSALLAFTAAQLLNGLVSLIEYAPTMGMLGTQLSNFMINAMPFIVGAKTVDETAINGVKCLTEALMLLTAAELLNGLTSFITGGIDFDSLGDDLSKFGETIVGFSDKLKEGAVDGDAVEAAAKAGMVIVELCNALPKNGGWVDTIFGGSDLGGFSLRLGMFGEAIVTFSQTVAGNISMDAVKSAKNAGLIMAELMEAIPKTDGILQLFTGTNDLDTFGNDIVQFGYDMRAFSQIVTGHISEEAATAAKNAGTILAELQNAIPASGGVKGWLFGDNDLGTFGDNLRELGDGLVGFSTTVAGVGTTNLNNAIDSCVKLVNMAKGMSGVDFGGVESFSDSLGNIGQLSVQNFVNAFKNAASEVSDAGKTLVLNALKGVQKSHEDFKKAGTAAVTKLRDGMETAKEKVSISVKTMMAKVLSTIRGKYEVFYNTGKFVVSGFAAGISANTYLAEAKAKAMANAAEKAAKEALGVNSPSKVFIPLGKAIPEGLVKGMNMLGGLVSRSSEDMAHTAVNSTRGVLSSIADAINSDIDTQPTIRPVLDLSDVSSGAGALNGMFSDQLVGVSANASRLSSSMNLRQNGANNDVISAIKDLGRRLGTSTGNTYMINGLSYSEGDDVAEAFKTIVRAARQERRS